MSTADLVFGACLLVGGGLLLLTFLEFLRNQLMTMGNLLSSGPRGFVILLITAVFSILRIAIIVSVLGVAGRVRLNTLIVPKLPVHAVHGQQFLV